MRGGFAKTYTPKKTVDWEKAAAAKMRAAWRKLPHEGPVAFRVTAYRKRTKDMCRPKNLHIKYCAVKPDGDNILKICMDSAVLAGVLKDDNLAVILHCQKQWADPGFAGWVDVEIELL